MSFSIRVCVHGGMLAQVWRCPQCHDSPLCAHILLLDRHTGYLAHLDAHLNVSELQTKVLPQDSYSGSTLARPSLREQLDQEGY